MKITNKEIILTQTDEAWFELNGNSRRSFDLYYSLLSSGIPKYDFLKKEDLTVSQVREGLDRAIGKVVNPNTSNEV